MLAVGKKCLTALGEGVVRASRVESSERGVPTRAAPRAPGRSSHALSVSPSARSPTSQAWTRTLKEAGNYPLMHPVLALRNDCTNVPKVAKIAGSLRVQSSAPSCNLRKRARCLATTRYDRHIHPNRRDPLDQPSVNRFQTRTCWSRTTAQFGTVSQPRFRSPSHTCRSDPFLGQSPSSGCGHWSRAECSTGRVRPREGLASTRFNAAPNRIG